MYLFLSQIISQSFQTENQSRRRHTKPLAFPDLLPINNLAAKSSGRAHKDTGLISPHYQIYVCMWLVVFANYKECHEILCLAVGSLAFLAVSATVSEYKFRNFYIQSVRHLFTHRVVQISRPQLPLLEDLPSQHTKRQVHVWSV